MFCWPSSASTARSPVWLDIPNGRFQSGGSFQITTVTWWYCGQYDQRAANICQWPGGKEDGIQWLLCSTFITWRVYGILRILCSALMSRALELCGGPCLAPVQQDRQLTRQGLCMSGRGISWYPAWCLTSRFFFSSKFMLDRAMPGVVHRKLSRYTKTKSHF